MPHKKKAATKNFLYEQMRLQLPTDLMHMGGGDHFSARYTKLPQKRRRKASSDFAVSGWFPWGLGPSPSPQSHQSAKGAYETS